MSGLQRDHISGNIFNQVDFLQRKLDELERASYVKKAVAPASAAATGVAGEISWDDNYIYVCTATDTWKRVAVATW